MPFHLLWPPLGATWLREATSVKCPAEITGTGLSISPTEQDKLWHYLVMMVMVHTKKNSGTASRDDLGGDGFGVSKKTNIRRTQGFQYKQCWNTWLNKLASNIFLTCGVELHKLQVLAGETSPGHHCISISGTSVSRCAAEVGSSIASVRKESPRPYWLSTSTGQNKCFIWMNWSTNELVVSFR